MTQETQTPQAAAIQRGDDPTLAPAELTDGELAQVTGGGDGPPTGPGDGTSVVAKASPHLF